MHNLITLIKKIPRAIPYDGSCSVQVLFHIYGKKYLRIGSGDPDTSRTFWIDIYTPLEYSLK